MKALFFGDSRRRLFGVWHPPRTEAARDCAVLLCYPAVQEYNLTHWAFRKLAGMLAREGLPAFRFDYSSTGDSAGDIEDGSLADWVEDIRTAAREARDLAGTANLAVVGMRLGATLALRAFHEPGLEVQELVLWEPVVSGAAYLAELEQLHELRRLQLLDPHPRSPDELMGYPFPPSLREQIAALDATAFGPPAAGRVTVISAAGGWPGDPLLRSLGPRARHHRLDESSLPHGEREAALLSNEALAAIVEALR